MNEYIGGACSICGKEECVVVYPLLPGEPKFCAKHYTPEFAEPYGVDFSPNENTWDISGEDPVGEDYG